VRRRAPRALRVPISLGALLHAHERDVHDPDRADKECRPVMKRPAIADAGFDRVELNP